MLGDGMHKVSYKGTEFTVTVNPLVAGNKKLLTFDSYKSSIHGKDVLIDGIQDQSFIKDLLLEATTHVNGLFRKEATEQYIFNAQHSYLRRIQSVVPRSALFLKKGEQQRLFESVGSFLNGRDTYAQFNVPYKLNILLHGLPGEE
jgi:hypothetical protein